MAAARNASTAAQQAIPSVAGLVVTVLLLYLVAPAVLLLLGPAMLGVRVAFAKRLSSSQGRFLLAGGIVLSVAALAFVVLVAPASTSSSAPPLGPVPR